MTASVHGFPWFVLTRLGVVHAKGPFVWIEALSGPEWNLEICAAQHEKRSDVFCDFNVFQCLQNYPTTHEAWSQTWQLVITWWPFDAFWIEVIWVVDSFQLLHGIPFRWRPSIESGPRGGTGFLGTLGTLMLSSKPYGNMMQYVTITSSPWFVVDALKMFPNLLRLKKTGSACLALLTGFEKDNFDDGAWGGMPVPGNWELNGSLAQIFLNLGSARARSIYAVVRHDRFICSKMP